MTSERDEVERPRLGMTILKWLAPLSSGALLGYLIMRASTCADAPVQSAPQRIAEPPAQSVKLDVARLESGSLPPRDAGAEPLEIRRDPILDTLRGNHLAGSKSGFGGLGLRRTGRSPDAAVPGLGELGAPGSNTGHGKGFLGGSKSGTLDVDSLREEPAPSDE